LATFTAGALTVEAAGAVVESVQEVTLEAAPAAVALASDGLWVTLPDEDAVLRLAPSGEAVGEPVVVDELGEGDDRLGFDIDAASRIAVTSGSPTLLWVSGTDEEGEDQIVLVDPAAGRVVDHVQGYPPEPDDLEVFASTLLVLAGDLQRVASGQGGLFLEEVTDAAPVGDQMAVDRAVLWVVDAGAEPAEVSRVNPSTGGRLGSAVTLSDDVIVDDITAADGVVWVTGRGGDVYRVNPRTGRVVPALIVSDTNIHRTAAGPGTLWFTTVEDGGGPGALYRVDLVKR
jgi:hypothetical protein